MLHLFKLMEGTRENENENNEVIEQSNISRLTDTPPVQLVKQEPVFYFGRRTIFSSLEKKDLTAEKILEILPQVLREHEHNRNEIDYLYNYYKGKQPIINKIKAVREDINNKVLENHAFEIVEFKKAYIYGEPIQYVQKGKEENKEINDDLSALNKFMENVDKSTLDKDLAEWQYICGTGYRWIDVNKTEKGDRDDDEAPYEMAIPDPRETFVVYNSGIKKEQLFSGNYCYVSENIMNSDGTLTINKHRVITIYTEDKMFKIKETAGMFELMNFELPVTSGKPEIIQEYPLVVKGHRIIEYPLNQARLGLIELVMSGLNAINQIKSDDLDGIDQFVQALLVFINQEVDIDTFKKLIAAGAIEVTTNDPGKPADVKLLTSQLLHSETKIVTDDIYNNILTICGIPRLNNKPTGGDTGQARLLGEGWTMADARAKQDEASFKKPEKQAIKLALKICKKNGELKNIKISDIDIKFTRNKSDNLLVKTQGLMNLKEAQVAPDVAFTTCGLFSDPNDAFAKSQQYFGNMFWKEKIEEIKNRMESQNKNNPVGGAKPTTQITSTDGKNGSVNEGVELGTKKS